MSNKNFHSAKRAKNDEFYTRLEDIEKELCHYKNHFKDKVIFCNCDDPFQSNFFKYFAMNFNHLGLKKLITTSYVRNGKANKIELTKIGDENDDGAVDLTDVEILLQENVVQLEGDGDFRSEECIELLKEADIVVTNPPFSLFREYVAQLVEHDKKFLIIGSVGGIVYKDCFKYHKEEKMWLGVNSNKTMEFILPDDYKKWDRIDSNGNKYGKVPAIYWYTNLEHDKQNQELVMYKKYTPEEYPHYDNYDAIEVSKVTDIPYDYDGLMGVPITFMTKYNPNQFEILGLANDKREVHDALIQCDPIYVDEGHKRYMGTVVNGKATYARIIIRHKRNK